MSLTPPPDSGSLGQRLDGWKVIAAYADRSERAVQRWAAERGFPVHRVGGGNTGSVYAWSAELDAWFARQSADTTAEPDLNGPGLNGRTAQPAPSGAASAAVTNSRRSRDASLWVTLVAGVAAGLLAGAAGTWLALRPRPATALAPGTLEPCHAVEWPTTMLPAPGGRFRIPVKALASPCTHWVAPTTESTWLLVTPPSTAATPARNSMNAIHPLAMPDYEPGATSLSLEVVANHTTAPRDALLRFGGMRVRIRQAGAREACTAVPGAGFVDGGWRYRITAARYRPSTELIDRVRAEVGPAAEPVTWQMLVELLEGNPDRGVEFAEAVGIPRQSWEELADAAECFNVHLTKHTPPSFISYHLGRKALSYATYTQINNNQYDLGRWDHLGHALYRERVR